jgi:hypothetical protein
VHDDAAAAPAAPQAANAQASVSERALLQAMLEDLKEIRALVAGD